MLASGPSPKGPFLLSGCRGLAGPGGDGCWDTEVAFPSRFLKAAFGQKLKAAPGSSAGCAHSDPPTVGGQAVAVQ